MTLGVNTSGNKGFEGLAYDRREASVCRQGT